MKTREQNSDIIAYLIEKKTLDLVSVFRIVLVFSIEGRMEAERLEDKIR